MQNELVRSCTVLLRFSAFVKLFLTFEVLVSNFNANYYQEIVNNARSSATKIWGKCGLNSQAKYSHASE